MQKLQQYRGLNSQKEWIFGNYTVIDGKHYILKSEGEISTDAETGQPLVIFEILGAVDPDTIDRFTGKTDKDGTPIYENDIVSGFRYADFYTGIDATCNARVIWIDDEATFVYDAEAVYKRYMRDDSDVKVIGNYHENPELMLIHDEPED